MGAKESQQVISKSSLCRCFLTQMHKWSSELFDYLSSNKNRKISYHKQRFEHSLLIRCHLMLVSESKYSCSCILSRSISIT